METSAVDANLKLFTDELCALMQIRPSGGVEENDGWFEGQELEVNKLLDEFYVLKDGKDAQNMSAEYELDLIKKVTQLRKYVKVLQECVSVETLQRELGADKLKRYSCKDLEIFMSEFPIPIGSGGFGTVYKGQFPDGGYIAVKVLKEDDGVEEMFMAELSTMGRTYHSYLVKLYGYCFEKKMKALVYEYMERGSFDKILYDNPHGLEWKKFYEIAISIAEGLSFLHRASPEPIIHYDVKAANVLIDSNLSPKITDFGLAKHIKNGASHRTNTALRGTGNYIAPELFFPWARATPKCDVYSYGMLLFEILGMKGSNRNNNQWFPTQVWEKFEAGELDDILEYCGISEENSDDAETLAMVALWCVQFTPKVRPTMSDVVEMLQKKMHVQRPQNPFVQSAEHLPTIQEESEEQSVRRRPPTRKPKRYSSKDLAKFTSNFSNVLSSGLFWKVYQGKFRDGVKVAVKVLEENHIDEEMFKTAVTAVGKAYHQHLVKLYGYCFDKNKKALVYEYTEKGYFDKILYGNPHGLNWKKFYEIAIGIAKGLSHLHDGCLPTIIHLDVKAANVLIDSNLSPKITDFESSMLTKKDASDLIVTYTSGSTSYVAPEIMYPFVPVSSKSDVYSFGMLLFEILGMKGNSQRDGWFPKQVWEKFEAGKLDDIINDCGIGEENQNIAVILSTVAIWCAQFTPSARPSMSTVVKMMEEEIPVPIPQNPFWPSAESSTKAMQPSLSDQRSHKRTTDLLESFQKLDGYPPGGENAAVVYTTSMTANRKIYDRCREVVSIISKHEVTLMVRDLYINANYKKELKDLLKRIELPAVFVDLRFIGGADKVIAMEEEDTLYDLFEEVNRGKGKNV